MIAAQRPEIRFVALKSEGQQAKAVLFRARDRLVHQRTELVNALRAVLYEFGHTVPRGIGNIKRIVAILEKPNCDLPALVCTECRDLVCQIAEQTIRIDAKTKTENTLARRLMTVPGVGPLVALNFISTVDDARPIALSVIHEVDAVCATSTALWAWATERQLT